MLGSESSTKLISSTRACVAIIAVAAKVSRSAPRKVSLYCVIDPSGYSTTSTSLGALTITAVYHLLAIKEAI